MKKQIGEMLMFLHVLGTVFVVSLDTVEFREKIKLTPEMLPGNVNSGEHLIRWFLISYFVWEGEKKCFIK